MGEVGRGGAYHHGDLRRALVEAALTLVSETQDWGFSLREVARRAGVSHNAPYRHFPEKRDLLAAIAAAGYEALRARMEVSLAGVALAGRGGPEAALVAIGVAYVGFGTENPARYRLTFGAGLAADAAVAEAAARAKAVLRGVIMQGVEAGRFAAEAGRPETVDLLVLAAWALVHGLTMLINDGLVEGGLAEGGAGVPALVARTLLEGVRRR